MKPEYDFSDARKNPYAKKLKRQVTINIDADTIDYFKSMADRSGIPYQTLINLYLSDCVTNRRQLHTTWN
nr:MAG TPA: antitoxin [Caudoviricetes sp.]